TNALSDSPWMAAGRAHYSTVVVGALFVAAVSGAETLADGLRRRATSFAFRVPCSKGLRRHLERGTRNAELLVLPCALLAAWLTGVVPGGPGLAVPEVGAHERLLERFLAQIPPDAAVSASTALVPHLSQRAAI